MNVCLKIKYIIAWLELNNMNGIELLVNSINKIDGKYNGKSSIKKNQLKVDLKKSSELMKGPGLIDYFSTIFEKEKKFEILIDHCDQPLFFIPLLYKISNKILFSNLSYLDNENRETLCLIKNNSVILEGTMGLTVLGVVLLFLSGNELRTFADCIYVLRHNVKYFE